MTTLRTLGTPRPDGPDARDRPKLFISSRCCCCWSGRPSHPRLLPGPGEHSLEPTPGPRGRTPSEATSPPTCPPPPPGQWFARLGRQALGGQQGPQQQAVEVAGWAGGDGARRGWQGDPGKARALGHMADTRRRSIQQAWTSTCSFVRSPSASAGFGRRLYANDPQPHPRHRRPPQRTPAPTTGYTPPHPPWEGPTLHTL